MSENLEILHFSLTIPSLKCHLHLNLVAAHWSYTVTLSHAKQNCLGPCLSFDFDSQSLSVSQSLKY